MSTADVINIFQVLVALAIIGIVLLQAKGQGLGNIFGGGGGRGGKLALDNDL